MPDNLGELLHVNARQMSPAEMHMYMARFIARLEAQGDKQDDGRVSSEMSPRDMLVELVGLVANLYASANGCEHDFKEHALVERATQKQIGRKFEVSIQFLILERSDSDNANTK